ncbi:MAG TPA: ribbon-helix-helix domain-containing protein [Candidatus Binatia bacterium]|jgi:hypothetical protein
MTMKKSGRPFGSTFQKIEAVRFTTEQLEAISDVARELRIPRSEAIRKATTLGLPLVREAMKIFVRGEQQHRNQQS